MGKFGYNNYLCNKVLKIGGNMTKIPISRYWQQAVFIMEENSAFLYGGDSISLYIGYP